VELVEDLPVGLAQDIGEDVEPAAVGHAEHDVLHAEMAAALNDLLQGRDHGLAAVEPEALGAEEFEPAEFFEDLGLDQLVEDCLLAFRREGDLLVAALDPLLQPQALLGIVDVHVFVADGAAIGAPAELDDLPRAGRFETHDAIGEDRTVEVFLVETVIGGLQPRVLDALHEPQRIEVGLEVAHDAVGANEIDGADRVARGFEDGVGRRRGDCPLRLARCARSTTLPR
jgi:hypothetical protein